MWGAQALRQVIEGIGSGLARSKGLPGRGAEPRLRQARCQSRPLHVPSFGRIAATDSEMVAPLGDGLWSVMDFSTASLRLGAGRMEQSDRRELWRATRRCGPLQAGLGMTSDGFRRRV